MQRMPRYRSHGAVSHNEPGAETALKVIDRSIDDRRGRLEPSSQLLCGFRFLKLGRQRIDLVVRRNHDGLKRAPTAILIASVWATPVAAVVRPAGSQLAAAVDGGLGAAPVGRFDSTGLHESNETIAPRTATADECDRDTATSVAHLQRGVQGCGA